MFTLLATDLDGTLVGDDTSLQILKNQLEELRKADKLKLVYVTGRSPKLFKALQAEKGLLEPDALITAVGTEIYVDGFRLVHWPNINSWDAAGIKGILSQFNELEEQPESEQKDYKISYFYTGNLELIHKIQQELGSTYTVIYSDNKYLDILPADVNKGTAIEFLYNYWRVPMTSVIACGDSENDIAMLEMYRAIVVGNANEKLFEWCKNSQDSDIYLAKGNYANGIIEGLKHFSILD